MDSPIVDLPCTLLHASHGGVKNGQTHPQLTTFAEIPREFPEISEAKSMRGFEPPTSQNLPLLQPR